MGSGHPPLLRKERFEKWKFDGWGNPIYNAEIEHPLSMLVQGSILLDQFDGLFAMGRTHQNRSMLSCRTTQSVRQRHGKGCCMRLAVGGREFTVEQVAEDLENRIAEFLHGCSLVDRACLPGLGHRDLFCALMANLPRGNCLDSLERLCCIVAVATLVADPDCDVLKDHEACFVLKGFALYVFFSNRSFTVLTPISELSCHISLCGRLSSISYILCARSTIGARPFTASTPLLEAAAQANTIMRLTPAS